MRHLLALIGLSVALSACAENGTWLQPRTAEDIQADGWVAPSASAAPTEPEKKVYCYHTLGSVDCYDAPRPGQERRLVRTNDP